MNTAQNQVPELSTNPSERPKNPIAICGLLMGLLATASLLGLTIMGWMSPSGYWANMVIGLISLLLGLLGVRVAGRDPEILACYPSALVAVILGMCVTLACVRLLAV